MTGKAFGVVFGFALGAFAVAQQPAMTAPMNPAPLTFGEVVHPAYKDAVLKIVRQPTISTKYASDDVTCGREMYEWLLAHPDRVSLAWRRMKVGCVEIKDLGNGRFGWNDDQGSDLVWQSVGTFTDGVVWYATGKVKPSPVTPTVPVKAVVVMMHPSKPLDGGAAVMQPVTQVYLQTDSKAANVVLKIIGPTAPKLAEQGADQLLYFFTGIARYLQKHPDRRDELLGPKK